MKFLYAEPSVSAWLGAVLHVLSPITPSLCIHQACVWNEWTLHSYPPSSSVASNLSYWNSKISLHRCYMLSLWSARWQIGVIQLLKGAFQTAPKPEFTFRVDSLAYVPYSHISDSGVCPHVPVTDWWCLRSVSTCGWFMAFWMNSGILCTVNPVSFSLGFFGFWSLNRPYRTTFNHKSCVWCVKSDPVTSNCSHS